jgi:hypothetical protein
MNPLMEITRHLSFRIEGKFPYGPGCVGGRVCGDAIRLGDRFTVEHRVEVHEDDGEMWSKLIAERCIDLKVTRIETYRRELEEIHRGMTCVLWVDGDLSGIDPESLLGDVLTRACHDAEMERVRLGHPSQADEGK